MKTLTLLGSTGSIGKNVCNVVKAFPDKFRFYALTTNKQIDLLYKQIIQFKPNKAVICDKNAYDSFKKKYKNVNIDILFGEEGLIEVSTAKESEYIINSLVGFAGLRPTISAIEKGKDIALANKETLVVAGDIVNKLAKENNVNIIPIDSEHSAIFQLLKNRDKTEIEKIILTASGGAFRDTPKNKLDTVKAQDALKHPTWDMGNKITIDSATMMNKGFEVIEAHHLFNIEYEKIDVIIHKESIIHSMIQTIDGEIYAQLGPTDMKYPIITALSYPEIFYNSFGRLDFAKVKKLSFDKVDYEKFPLLKTAFDVGKKGGSLPVILNASNEIVVNEFLKGKIKFPEIAFFIHKALEEVGFIENPTLLDIYEIDTYTREYTKKII